MTDIYITRSEVEMNKGFADIYFQPFLAKYPEIGHSYLLELKYLRRGELNGQLLEAKIGEATEQLSKYAQDPFVQATPGATKLRKLLAVFHGWELVHREECHAEHVRR
ncbi:MAG: PD-(D/E)XK nuclease domain-containing protein [Acidobacteriota bacterium]